MNLAVLKWILDFFIEFQLYRNLHRIRVTLQKRAKHIKQHKYGLTDLNCDSTTILAPVVQRLDNVIQRINRYPVDKCLNKPRYPLDSDLSGG